MGFMAKLADLVGNKNLLISSSVTTISTRYGLFKVQAYKSGKSEYLVIMSRGFYELKEPIVYIHSNFHMHTDPNSNIRYSGSDINSILKIIHKVGGLIIYPSYDGKSIDELLKQMNARKLEAEQNGMKKEKIDLGFKVDEQEYHSLCLILKKLNLSTVKLVTNDIKLAALTERVGINVVKRVPLISFEYGK